MGEVNCKKVNCAACMVAGVWLGSSEGILLEDCLSFQNWLHRNVPFQKANYCILKMCFVSQAAVQFTSSFLVPGNATLPKNYF